MLDSGDPGTGAGQHRTTTSEKGSFCIARCSCGWYGPARRSRDKARTDASDHAAELAAEPAAARTAAPPPPRSAPSGPGIASEAIADAAAEVTVSRSASAAHGTGRAASPSE
ncbi:hypothetical protein ACH4S9_46260 [Streptomyces sp. NPDC021225]|uniref:hypothetical protein n=1 Tax=Streptomyces sp. NPDC021225 TaxID=3365121 RepID=UPI0037B75F86